MAVTPSSQCSCHRITMEFSVVITIDKMMSMQKVKIRGRRSRSQRSKPNLTVLPVNPEATPVYKRVSLGVHAAFIYDKRTSQDLSQHVYTDI